MHTIECPLKWLLNQKSSVAVSSVLWTQVNVHRDGIAIRNHPLLFDQFYAPKRVSTEMALQSQIIRCYLISFMQFYQFLITFMHTSKCPPRRCCHQGSSINATSRKQFFAYSQCPLKCCGYQISPTTAMLQRNQQSIFVHHEQH